jgi:hypothetical protein
MLGLHNFTMILRLSATVVTLTALGLRLGMLAGKWKLLLVTKKMFPLVKSLSCTTEYLISTH